MIYSDYRKQVQSILANAGFYQGAIDGYWGPLTREASDNLANAKDVAAVDNLTSPATAPATGTGMVTPSELSNFQFPPVDARSESNIATIHKVRPLARALVNAAAARGITIKVTSGTRTYQEQNDLYEQGRTKPGPIVTNARGGYSNHNFGVAFDVTVFIAGAVKWDGPEYKVCGQLGKALGLDWGGDWKSIQDEPHFELRPQWAATGSEENMLSELRTRYAAGKDAFA